MKENTGERKRKEKAQENKSIYLLRKEGEVDIT